MTESLLAQRQDPAAATSLPIVDLSRLDGGPDERAALAAELRKILFDHGFFYLTGHGIAPEVLRETIEAAKEFFNLPEADKLAINIVNSPQFRGYTRAGGEITGGQPDWREQVDFDCEEEVVEITPETPAWKRTLGPNQWPAAMPRLRPVILRYQAEVTRVGINVLRAIALALGQKEDAFRTLYEPQPRQHLKIIRYPGRDATTSDQGVGAHKDGGLVTLLLQRERHGLRVLQHDGTWIEVPPIPNTFIVNTGELLELATDGFVRADIHEAVTPPAGTCRSSMAFFLGASHEGSVPFIELPPELKDMARGVSSDPANPLFRDVGVNHLKARIRSHPDVARAHYADLI